MTGGKLEPRISRAMAEDHARLDALLRRAVSAPGGLHRGAFDAFREGLLRHIALEEKILLPAAREARGGEPLPLARRLRVDHGALASLLVPTPTADLVREIRSILDPHNALEEAPGGLYEQCDALLAPRRDEVLRALAEYPKVKVAGYYDGPRAYRRAAEALAAIESQLSSRDPRE